MTSANERVGFMSSPPERRPVSPGLALGIGWDGCFKNDELNADVAASRGPVP